MSNVTPAAETTPAPYGAKPEEAAHLAYLAAYSEMFDTIFKLACGKVDSKAAYEALARLDQSSQSMADARFEAGVRFERKWSRK